MILPTVDVADVVAQLEQGDEEDRTVLGCQLALHAGQHMLVDALQQVVGRELFTHARCCVDHGGDVVDVVDDGVAVPLSLLLSQHSCLRRVDVRVFEVGC